MTDLPPDVPQSDNDDREKDIDAVIEIYRAARQFGRLGLYFLYVIAAILGIILSIKKLLQ